jgi:hypothetical protein
MRGVIALVKVCENWSKCVARVQLLRGLRILGVHVNHEVAVLGKERHLAFRITTIGTVGVGLDELPDSKAIRGVFGNTLTLVKVSIANSSSVHRL